MISKEILSEVLELKYPIRIIHHSYKGQNVLNYDLHVECALFQESINIYELAHKCKEWAFKQGFDLVCKRKYTLSRASYYECNVEKLSNFVFYFEEEFSSEISEPEAIFKACEWIKDNK